MIVYCEESQYSLQKSFEEMLIGGLHHHPGISNKWKLWHTCIVLYGDPIPWRYDQILHTSYLAVKETPPTETLVAKT